MLGHGTDKVEIWKEVPGSNGVYEVSNKGRLRSYRKVGRKPGILKEPRLLKRTIGFHGYYTARLTLDGKTKLCRTARLVLMAFVGPCPPGMECLHGPNGSTDDSLENLSWGTREQNMGADRVRDGTDNRGEKHGMSKLTSDDVIKIRRLLKDGELNQNEIASLFNVYRTTISRLKNGRRWGWLNKD